jgi:hypothetical protein
MTAGAHDLLQEARRRGITVTLDGGDLRLRGPGSALTAEFLDRMACQKDGIRDLLAGLSGDKIAKVLRPISSPWGNRPIGERIRAVQDLVGGRVLSQNREGFSLVCDGNEVSDLEGAVESITTQLNTKVVGRGKYGFQVSFRFRDSDGCLHDVYAHISFPEIRCHEDSSSGGPGR